MTCPHRQDGICQIATEICDSYGQPAQIPCRDDAYKACTECGCPYEKNYVSCSLAAARLRHTPVKDRMYVELTPWLKSGPKCEIPPDQMGQGIGTELHLILLDKGYALMPGCKCLENILNMNRGGLPWVEANTTTIVDSMVTEARRRKITVLGVEPPELFLRMKARQWIREAIEKWKEKAEKKIGRRLILKSGLCPGDILTMTAAVESLHKSYPGEYATDVRTSTDEIWDGNPHITKLSETDPSVSVVEMQYETIHRSGQEPVAFIGGYTEFLSHVIGRPLTLKTNRPHLYLFDEEKQWKPQVDGPFWLVNAGIKNDYTTKGWPVEYFQEVIDQTKGAIQWVQVGALEHSHPRLDGVVDLRGQTDHRQLIRLAWHCRGGLGPVTYLQHLCAAWERPYICLLGGRESVTWVQYPKQFTLHTIGSLDCCRNGGCWVSRVVPLDEGDKSSLCKQPVLGGVRPAAKCMAMIRPEEVLQILERIAA